MFKLDLNLNVLGFRLFKKARVHSVLAWVCRTIKFPYDARIENQNILLLFGPAKEAADLVCALQPGGSYYL